MKKTFYTHLVEQTNITLEIAELDVTNKERVHLLSLMQANIHSSVVLTVLSSLSKEDKKIFLKNLAEENNEKIWAHLKTNVTNMEDKLRQTIDKTLKELLEDVKEVRQ